MLLLTTLVLVGSGLAASTPAVKKMRLRKSTCRTWLSERPMDRDRGKRQPRSLLLDGIQKTLEPLFGQTHSRQLQTMLPVAVTETTSALEKPTYRELGLPLLNIISAALGLEFFS